MMKLQASVQIALIGAVALHQSGSILSVSALTCASCTTCTNEAQFSSSVTIQHGGCPSGRSAYLASIAIDSPREDSFTYRTYESADSSLYYVDCSHDSSPLCYVVDSNKCGRIQNDQNPAVTITCANLFQSC